MSAALACCAKPIASAAIAARAKNFIVSLPSFCFL
jgi:hypothetical protein